MQKKLTVRIKILFGVLVLVGLFFTKIKYSEAYVNGTPTTIASAGTLANPTFHSAKNQLFFDGTRWWAFYLKSTTANTLFYSYSTDLVTWTEASVALGGTIVSDGGTISVLYDSATGVVLVSYYTNTNNDRYMRGNISGTSITWTANTVYADTTVKNATGGYSYDISKDSTGKVLYTDIDTYANPKVLISTNVISTTFADTGTSWTVLTGADATYALNDYENQESTVPLASSGLLIVVDDLNVNPCIDFISYNGSTWSAAAGAYSQFVLACAAGVSRTNWGLAKISNTDVRFLGQATASTFSYQTFNGTAWSALTAPSWPTGGLATNSGVSLITDGIDVWAFVVRGDTNNTVSYNKYSGTTWSGWTDITTTAATRSYIQTAQGPGDNKIAVLWTQVSGTNYNVTVDSIKATYVQAAYRLFNNLNSTDVGTPLAALSTPAILGSTGAAFRARLLIHRNDFTLPLSGQQFKLQFVGKGTGTCAAPTGGTPATYTDVTAATTIGYSNNTTPVDGAALTANANDPTDGANTIVNQTYEELNNFTNSVAAISTGQDGKWDFSLFDNGAPAGKTFCLRAVRSDGTALETYTTYPEFTTAAVAQTISFSLGASTLSLGALSSSAVRSGSHTISLATNAASGMVVSYSGPTLTSGSNTIAAMSVAAASSPGSQQFGINAVANTTPAIGAACSGTAPIAAAATGYATTNNFKFVSGQTVVSSTGPINATACTISYIANISPSTAAGSYSSTLTYTATATF